LEKQFFEKKNLSVRLQAYDLLNENTNISRTVTGTGFTDTRTNRLGKYFMLSGVFRLNKFKGEAPSRGGMGAPPPPHML
jgi:hypothetical protein